MRLSSGQTRAELALLTRLRSACGTTHCESLFRLDFHRFTVHACTPTRWSILTIARSYRRRIISVDSWTAKVSCDNLHMNTAASQLHLSFLGVIPCSINWLRRQTRSPNRRCRTQDYRPTRSAPNSHPLQRPHIPHTRRSRHRPILPISLTAKSLHRMNILTNRIKTFSRKIKYRQGTRRAGEAVR